MTKNTEKILVEELKPGQVCLINARKVGGGKLQLEFGEVLAIPGAVNALSLFNKSDDRFSSGKARRAWLTAESQDAAALLGINLGDDNPAWTKNESDQDILPLNILNPVVTLADETDHPLKVEIRETVVPSEWQASNIDQAAKRRGADGAFITHNGMYIFSNTAVVFDKANHILLKADELAPAVSQGITAAIGISANGGLDN